jgi:hypothetical protein
MGKTVPARIEASSLAYGCSRELGLKETLEGETQRGLRLKLCWTDFTTCPNLRLHPSPMPSLTDRLESLTLI